MFYSGLVPGMNCETNVDDCVWSSCIHSRCVDLIQNYRCDCDPGYTGDNCSVRSREWKCRPELYSRHFLGSHCLYHGY